MYSTTLCLPVLTGSSPQLLLGMKKTGFGRGKYNGFGGKVERGESIRQAAVRELYEESGLLASEAALKEAGRLEFIFPGHTGLNHDVFIFLLQSWQNQPVETSEMKPFWFCYQDIPYQSMWADDQYWLPTVLAGKKVCGTVVFKDNGEDVEQVDIRDE